VLISSAGDLVAGSFPPDLAGQPASTGRLIIFDPGDASVTPQTLTRAIHAIGRDLRIEPV